MSATTSTLKMKLLIDTKAKCVVFAEASKEVVDFLFSLLTLPLATVVKMLDSGSLPGSFGNLYGSVEDLDDGYVLPGADKKSVLHPEVVPSAATSLLLPAPESGQRGVTFFTCSRDFNNCRYYVAETRGVTCPNCSKKMDNTLNLKFVADGGSGSNMQNAGSTAMVTGAAATKGGLVQGVVTYTVRDDLTVTPMSTISGISMVNAAGVADFAALQEKTVLIGYAEGLAIVKASLQSKTVLTDVFLANKRSRGGCA